MENKTQPFGKTRRKALQLWGEEAKRDCSSINDNMDLSYECRWQDRAVLELEYDHISIFCSLGEWASNISDILQNSLYDWYDFLDGDCRDALFRYYTRFLLVVSEILCDFVEIAKKIRPQATKGTRKFLSSEGQVDSLLGYVNNVCKHKVGAIHRCNHHLPIWFEDCGESCPFSNPISLVNLEFEQPDGILVPRLNDVIEIILTCYRCLDTTFRADPDGFRSICNEYNGESLLA